MSKLSKYIIIPLFTLIILFGLGIEAKGYDLKCADPAPGFKNVVFVKTLNAETVGESSKKVADSSDVTVSSMEPAEGGEVKCITVPTNRTSLTYEDFVNNNWALGPDADNAVQYQRYDGCEQYNKNIWEDYEATKNFIDTEFVLDKYWSRPCSSYNLKERVRYAVEQAGTTSDFYLYYIGIGMPDGIAGAIPNKTCWDSDETTCKGQYKDQCFWYPIPNVHNCQARIDPSICGSLPENFCGEDKKIGSYACVWNKAESKCLTILKDSVQQNYGRPQGYEGPLPTCAFSGDCDNVNDILQLLVNFAWGGLLSIIGMAAFLMFVWAGFTIILSFGNPEKVKKGWHMMISAVIGMAIAFGAYLLIDFILTTLDVPASLRGIGR